MANDRKSRLEEFAAWASAHITGDEKGEAQIFLDRLFQAFGRKGLLEVGGQTEFRIRKAKEDGGGTSFADYVWKPLVLVEMKKRGTERRRRRPRRLRLLGQRKTSSNNSSTSTSKSPPASNAANQSTPPASPPTSRTPNPSSPTIASARRNNAFLAGGGLPHAGRQTFAGGRVRGWETRAGRGRELSSV